MKYEVIDNFLDKEYFDNLKRVLVDKDDPELDNSIPPKFPVGSEVLPVAWEFTPNAVSDAYNKNPLTEYKFFYMVHSVYDNHVPLCATYNNLVPLLNKLNIKALLRIKANLYPNTEMIHEHPMHRDCNYSHCGAILSLNTCDGYTKLKDGTKIDSVANRMLFFDPGEEHCSTTATNVKARFNLNINYF
jgi:hypothetical protein